MLDNVNFKYGLSFVLKAVSKECNRPILQGVLFEFKPGKLTMVGCDGKRMHIFTMPFHRGYENSFVLWANELKQMKIISNGSTIDIEVSDSGVCFKQYQKGEWIQWEMPTIPGLYPPYGSQLIDPDDRFQVVRFKNGSLKMLHNIFKQVEPETCILQIDPKTDAYAFLPRPGYEVSIDVHFDALVAPEKLIYLGINPLYLYDAFCGEDKTTYYFDQSPHTPVYVKYDYDVNCDQFAVIMPMAVTGYTESN